jgi:hypothetical protein
MTVLTPQQAAGYANEAGFTGKSLAIILSIAQQESGLDTHKLGQSDPRDRGILQINSHWHPEVSDNCAFDPACAFNAGYRISKQGTDFGQWTTYTNGHYLRSMPTMQAVANSSVASPYQAYQGTPWYDFGISRGHSGGEHGVDLGTPLNTPMTAVFSGVITDISGFPSSGRGTSPTGWGGQVTWKLDNPQPAHGAPYEYVIHLNAINPNLKVGSHLNSGDLVGWTGGEIPGQPETPAPSGGFRIDNPTYSTGAHTEIGLAYGPQFGTGQGYDNPDPTFMIAMAQGEHLAYGTGNLGSGTSNGTTGTSDFSNLAAYYGSFAGQPMQKTGFSYGQLSDNVHNTLVQYQGFYGICLALDEAEQFPGLYPQSFGPQDNILQPWNMLEDTGQAVMGTLVNNAMPFIIRGGLIVFGYLLLFMLFWQFIKPVYKFGLETAGAALPMLAAGAA